MQRKKIAGIIGLVGLIAGMASAVVSVSNLSVAQRPGTKLLDISYDVSSTETNEVTVSLEVKNGTTVVNAPSVTGDIGSGVTTGFGKSMVWDMGADWNEQVATLSCTVVADDTPIPPAPSGMVLIPAGTFQMGDSFGEGGSDELPVHSVFVSAFYMDQTEVTKAQWDEVYTWAIANGYSLINGLGKAANHPQQTVSWYDCVKWANARSEKAGRTPCYTVGGTVYRTGESTPDCNWTANGYRLPTEAEWEKAARGGVSSHRFPWSDSDTIQHARANYYSSASYAYDTSPTRDYHPTYAAGGYPYTSPAGAFSPNGYGLVDMAGNVFEWCWDWHESSYYASSPSTDPRGPVSGSVRVLRGGGWYYGAYSCHVAYRYGDRPADGYDGIGFRLAVSVGQ